MKIDKALAVVRSMQAPKRVRLSRRAFQALTYQPPTPKLHWTWATATPQQKAHFVRESRKLGMMDWDLVRLFDLTCEGLAEIVKGKDWRPDHIPDDGQPTKEARQP